MKKRMSLPTDCSFKLDSGEVIRFRPVCMYDYEWCYNNLGKEIDEIWNNEGSLEPIIDDLYRLFYQQIPDVDRAQYVTKEYRTVDENGKEQVVEIGGYKALQKKIDKYFITAQRTYMNAITVGSPEKTEADDDGKKKVKKSER